MTVRTFGEIATDLVDEKLIQELKSTYDLVHNIQCFNSKDVSWLEVVVWELESRGYEIKLIPEVVKI